MVRSMKISKLTIQNFKSIRYLHMEEVDNALILVGRNNTGKTVVIDALLMVAGIMEVDRRMFQDTLSNIEIGMTLEFSGEDLGLLHKNGVISRAKKYEKWLEEFKACFPEFRTEEEEEEDADHRPEEENQAEAKPRLGDAPEAKEGPETVPEPQPLAGGSLTFTFLANYEGRKYFREQSGRNNDNIRKIFPRIHYINNSRSVQAIQQEIFALQASDVFEKVQSGKCMFDEKKSCNHCFQCIGKIQQKKPLELSVIESARLLEYQIHHLNIRQFSEKVNACFQKNNGPAQEIRFTMQLNRENMFSLDTLIVNKERNLSGSMQLMSEGTRSIYLLSLLEAYIAGENGMPCIIMIEDPENYLHPQLQKVAGEILYRLSKKNQIIFSTHSPNMLFNFTQKQIKQVVLDRDYTTTVRENVDIDEILDDLGYTANDLMNVSFVFIVEGKQDKNRLPLLLEKYYSEIYDEDGMLQRISIVPTNSCTNIKTYANLKYINQLYLKDQFLMIRDSDGKNPKHLVKQLCSYYQQRAHEEGQGSVPRVQPRNVLILKYYSFENYFLDPAVMEKIGVLKDQEDFYNILYDKYRSYLYKLTSWKRMAKRFGLQFRSKEDLKKNMETIKIYVRGHNLYDIFYGRYRGDREKEILKKYIDAAPRECFADILQAIDSFVYFESRKKDQ